MMDAKCFDAMAVEGENILLYDRNCLEHDTAFGV